MPQILVEALAKTYRVAERAPGLTGALSGLVFHTDDIRALYETLQERGVTDFTQEPIDHFYGTDMGLRDPFGNAIRVLERKTAAAATA